MADSKVDRTAFRKRIFAYRARIAAAIIGVIIAIGVLVIVLTNAYKAREYTDYDITNSVERLNVEGSRVLAYGNKFLTYSADGIHCTDANGTEMWSFSFEMQNPMVETNGNYIACAEFNGSVIYIFDSNGITGQIFVNVPVKRIIISATGIIAAITDEGSITPITLYKPDGSLFVSFKTTMSKFGYPVALGFSDDSKLVGVSYLYLDSGQLTSKVAFYNFDEVGKNATNHLVSGFDLKDEIVPIVKFLNNDISFALGSNSLTFFEGDERPTNPKNIKINEQIYAAFYGDNRVGLVFLNSTGETTYKMVVYKPDGSIENELKFDLEYSDIFFANDKVFIYNATSGLIYDNTGRCKFNGDFKDPVSLIIPSNTDTKYVLVTPDSIQNITLK